MVASPQQLAVASAGVLYVFQLQTQGLLTAGIFTKVPVATFTGPVAQLGYSDGFFIVLVATSQKFYVSNPLDPKQFVARSTSGAGFSQAMS